MEKVIVDKDICIGCGFCAANLDQVFKMDDDDLAVATNNEITEENKEEIMDILEGCPVGAIKTEES